MKKIMDYMQASEKKMVAPIGSWYSDLQFLTMGHLVISKALGFELEQATPILTVVKEGQLKTEEELDKLIEAHSFDFSPMKDELEYFHQLRKWHPDKLVGGGCFGPLTVVSGILGAENMLRWIVKKPAMVEKFVAYVTEYLIEVAKRELEEQMDFFWIAEPVASLLAPKKFWQFSGKYLKLIFEAGEVPGILHVCGQTLKHTPYMVDTGAEVLSIDYCTDLGECIRMVPKDVVIMGNVSPALLQLGTKEEVEQEVQKILDASRGFDNFILSTGCVLMEDTPDTNVQVLYDMGK